ncbi:hypothetical protein DUNSADRAFT_5614 [Dunaliella salina]|uniref:Uncharacterized protein n=1 Tax=Dunaliella salina TaxID=3046 RepID=A0ABQ7GPX6_DUNSA|nr:hypothetical protein DUNSADRAFT_5614 [Dunaliella salina]|eukprot:KAF5836655.1 hypothetical protein DUNSADRAFT_5614 [Dunaliella salina]
MGPWTMAININPTDINSSVVFELAGKKHTVDSLLFGATPQTRPDLMERLRTVAKNPVACATYFMLFIQVKERKKKEVHAGH